MNPRKKAALATLGLLITAMVLWEPVAQVVGYAFIGGCFAFLVGILSWCIYEMVYDIFFKPPHILDDPDVPQDDGDYRYFNSTRVRVLNMPPSLDGYKLVEWPNSNEYPESPTRSWVAAEKLRMTPKDQR